MKKNEIFRFKKFDVSHRVNAQKVCTDSVLLGAWADYAKAKNILDIGTGCGVMALMAAQRNPEAIIFGIEIETPFAEEADQNFKSSSFSDRLNLLNEDIRAFSEMKFDHIICNPPYFSNSLKSDDASRNLARHDSNLSLEELAESVFRLLEKEGRFSLVIPLSKQESTLDTFERKDFFLLRECQIKHHMDSPVSIVLMEFGFHLKDPLLKSELVLKDGLGHSEEYKELLTDFLLIF